MVASFFCPNPESTLINKVLSQNNHEIPYYPDYVFTGGSKDMASYKLYRIKDAIVLEDYCRYYDYSPRQILINDNQVIDCSSGKPFRNLLADLKNIDNL